MEGNQRKELQQLLKMEELKPERKQHEVLAREMMDPMDPICSETWLRSQQNREEEEEEEEPDCRACLFTWLGSRQNREEAAEKRSRSSEEHPDCSCLNVFHCLD